MHSQSKPSFENNILLPSITSKLPKDKLNSITGINSPKREIIRINNKALLNDHAIDNKGHRSSSYKYVSLETAHNFINKKHNIDDYNDDEMKIRMSLLWKIIKEK